MIVANTTIAIVSENSRKPSSLAHDLSVYQGDTVERVTVAGTPCDACDVVQDLSVYPRMRRPCE